MNEPQIARVILFVRDVPKVAAFYERFFHMHPLAGGSAKWIELASASGGCAIAVHQASVGQKSGAAIKIVFGIAEIRAFKAVAEQNGLKFGVVHEVDGFEFCNAKDPAGNSIQISSRGLSGIAKH